MTYFSFTLIFFLTLIVIIISNHMFKYNEKSIKEFLNDQLKLNETDMEKHHYCSLCCLSLQTGSIEKTCGQHTLCKYSANEKGSACHGFIKIPFTKKEKLMIVFIHNQLRNYVALGKEDRGNPGPQYEASNMREMFWNDELALIADRWSSQCVLKNDVCRDTARFPVGQNIAVGQSAINDEMYFIRKWYNVVQDYNRGYIRNITLENRFNSYTQIVWADTYLIGCSRIMIQVNSGPEIFYKEHMICNYGPTGNIIHQPVYSTGKACTNCPQETKCSTDFEGLCTANISSSIIMSDEFSNYEFNWTLNKIPTRKQSENLQFLVLENKACKQEDLNYKNLIIFYVILFVIYD